MTIFEEPTGQTAYEAYVEAVGGTSYQGHPLPKWEDLGTRQQCGWDEATKKVIKDYWQFRGAI